MDRPRLSLLLYKVASVYSDRNVASCLLSIYIIGRCAEILPGCILFVMGFSETYKPEYQAAIDFFVSFKSQAG